MGGSLVRKSGHFPPRGAFSWTSLCCMNFQYPEFDRWCDQRPVAFWQRRGSKVAWLDISLIKAGIVGHAPGTLRAIFKTLGRSLPGIRYGLGKRRYREIARCGPRDDCGEHSALVLRDLGERLNAARYEIVDPSPCFDDRQQDG